MTTIDGEAEAPQRDVGLQHLVSASECRVRDGCERALRVEAVPERQPEHLHKQTCRSRSAASAVFDARALQTLLQLTEECEQQSEAPKPVENLSTRMSWDKADGRMPDPTPVNYASNSDRPERTSIAVDRPIREELRRRCEQHDIDQAKLRILTKVVRGLPINVFERKLVAGELPPGLIG